MSEKPTIVVVDSNCFIRLLFSPLRPILGSVFCGHKLMTLADLAAECGPDTHVTARHPWLLHAAVQKELANNCLRFREPKATAVKTWSARIRVQGNRLLRAHCMANKLDKIRELSRADASALAAAQVLGGALATDEWPLTWAAERVSDVETVLTSIGLVHLMEKAGRLTEQGRADIVSAWLKQGEILPVKWRQEYEQLFGKAAPSGQR